MLICKIQECKNTVKEGEKRVYCSEECVKEAKKFNAKSARAKRKIVEKKCTECGKFVRESAMRSRCRKCMEKNKIKKEKKCVSCGIEVKTSRMRYCDDCKIKQKEVYAKRQAEKYQETKLIRYKKIKEKLVDRRHNGTIDQKWLTRGAISNNGDKGFTHFNQ